MNYLSHLFLSFENEPITIGNFIADFVKGKKYLDYPEGVQQGILIHREIDHYADNHPIFLDGKRRLAVDYRHYAGVIMDIYYDHFLAKNWSDYSNENLKDFCNRQYQLLHRHQTLLPDKCNYLLGYMESGDWLYNYQFIEGIQFALSGMSRRTSFTSGMERAVKNLTDDYERFEREFQLFFKEILSHIHNFTAQIKK
ncbi:ACP phosphodiesterase [Reichenbachiella carrageenanivorans]|uniref:ACP phosphodiesterase n=1 Tax=Reichenbachiella carrageenanivorans TaxID=2979869 RepID=A0ABY6CVQ7_9BACT|nr:ACP phosphodiesterase [Reichenbachiella carrageenanivorans]UXX77814.1 ACP phosphodiesterase [Reichenbachiella carrageenanivorans]